MEFTNDACDWLFERSREAVMARDAEGRITLWSPGAAALLGYTPAQAIGSSYEALLAPQPSASAEAIAMALGRDGRWEGQITYRRGDGATLPLASRLVARKGQVLEVAAPVAPAYMLESVLDAIPDVLYVLDLDGRLVRWNKQLERVTGYAPQELSGRPVLEFFPVTERAAIAEAIAEKLEQGFAQVEGHLIRKDGSQVLFSWAGVPLAGADGHVVGLTGIGRDISERKRLEQALRDQNERLQELDELKDAFVDAVSHELRTPLSTIIGYGEFLADGLGGPLTPDQQMFVGQVQGAAARLRRLVDDLIDVSRLSAGSFKLMLELVDLDARVGELVQTLRSAAEEKGVRLHSTVPEERLLLLADPTRLDQVLLHLIDNALKFTPAGGTVEVRVRVLEGEVRVEVDDTGIGVRPEDRPKLFERFFQADPSSTREAGGTGLGLAISKSIVEAHGGRIGMESKPDGGCIFWFTLPLPPPERLRLTLYTESETVSAPRSPESGTTGGWSP